MDTRPNFIPLPKQSMSMSGNPFTGEIGFKVSQGPAKNEAVIPLQRNTAQDGQCLFRQVHQL